MTTEGFGTTGPVDREAELFALDPATCLALLRAQPVGRLVTGGVDPHVIPVNFVVVDDTIVFRTEAGGTAELAAGEEVMFEVDMFDQRTHSGWSVVVRGRLATGSGEPPNALVTWAPGRHERWMLIGIAAATGRLLRGAVDAPDDPAGGYL
jgi:nitroimidazol reductase NimA-like FMN-containing flavoprotein (pyridoxamine 5'-phosphate oxidase superfamily)